MLCFLDTGKKAIRKKCLQIKKGYLPYADKQSELSNFTLKIVVGKKEGGGVCAI